MPGDKPQFLQSVPETDEERDVMSVLEDEPTGEEPNANEPEQSEDASTAEDTDSSAAAADTDTSAGTSADDGATDDSNGDTDTDTDDTSSDDSKSADEAEDKPEEKESQEDEQSKEDVDKVLEMKFGNFKTPEEAEKAYKELQRTLTKLRQQATQEPSNKKEEAEQKKAADQYLELAKKTPLVDVKIPKAENYQLESGNFDIQNFSKDLVQNTVMSIQQGLIGGQLGSMQFGLMSEALGEEWQSAQAEQERTKSAQAIEQKLYQDYPVLKDNEEVSELFEQAVWGEFTRRKNRDGEEAKPLTEDDYFSIAKRIMNNIKIEAPEKKKEAADKPTGQGGFAPGESGKQKPTGVEKDIEDMRNASRTSSGSIF